jgi:hypothetical protein
LNVFGILAVATSAAKEHPRADPPSAAARRESEPRPPIAIRVLMSAVVAVAVDFAGLAWRAGCGDQPVSADSSGLGDGKLSRRC